MVEWSPQINQSVYRLTPHHPLSLIYLYLKSIVKIFLKLLEVNHTLLFLFLTQSYVFVFFGPSNRLFKPVNTVDLKNFLNNKLSSRLKA